MTINGQQIIRKTIKLCGGIKMYANAVPKVPEFSSESLLYKKTEVIISSTIIDDDKNIPDYHLT